MSIKKEIDYGKWKMLIEIDDIGDTMASILIVARIINSGTSAYGVNLNFVHSHLDCLGCEIKTDGHIHSVIYKMIVSYEDCITMIKEGKKGIEKAIQDMYTAYAEKEKNALEAFEKIKTELSML